MEGNSGSPQGVRRVSSSPPAPAKLPKRIMPSPLLELPPDMKITVNQLREVMTEQRYSSNSVEAVVAACKFVERLHSKEKRKTGRESYLVHPLTVAIRMARMKFDAVTVCTAALHDSMEDAKADSPVTPSKIEELFANRMPPEFGRIVAENVTLLTKPLLSPSKSWVFADSPDFPLLAQRYQDRLLRARRDEVPDEENPEVKNVKRVFGTHKSMYDVRSKVYYQKLLDSGRLGAILVKIHDNLHNLETLAGIKPKQREKNLSTMINNTLLLAEIFLTPADVKYIRQRIEAWYPDLLPPLMERPWPTDSIVLLPRRDRLDLEALLAHPSPEAAFISIYGSDVDAFVHGYIEIGLPPRLPIDYRKMLEKFLPESLFCEPEKSMVPDTIASHEKIFRIFGFESKGFQIHLRASRLKGFMEILDNEGNVLVALPAVAFSTPGVYFGPGLNRPYSEVLSEYQELLSRLRILFEKVLCPEIEKLQAQPDPGQEG